MTSAQPSDISNTVGHDEPRESSRGRLWTLAAVLLVGVVAAALRFYRLADLPPGLHVDEAVNGLDTLITIPQSHPIFFELNNGREPLFIYLQYLSVILFGASALSLRLVSAVVGTLTVLAVYGVGRSWFGGRVATIAALGLATSFWHLDLSRVGLRAIAAPLFLALAMWLLWRGFRRGSMLSFAGAGLATSLGLYTYLSGRFAAVALCAVVVWELLLSPRETLRRWAGVLVFASVAFLATSPLTMYFVEHPESFIGRGEQVSIFNPSPTIEGKPSTFGENLLDNLGTFFVRGDVNPRHNVPGRPVFDPIGAPWLVLGFLNASILSIVALTRIRPRGRFWLMLLPSSIDGKDLTPQPPSPAGKERPSHEQAFHVSPRALGWLMIWLVVMMGPGVFTHESPNYLRLTAVAPAVYLIWALGLDLLYRGAVVMGISSDSDKVLDTGRKTRHARGLATAVVTLVVAAVVGAQAIQTYRTYFFEWATRADVYQSFDAGLAEAAGYVQSVAAPGTTDVFYVDRSPTILFLSEAARAGRWMQGFSSALVIPAGDPKQVVYVFDASNATADVAGHYLGGFAPESVGHDPRGAVTYRAYRVSSDDLRKAFAGPSSVGQRYSDVELLGANLDRPTVEAGKTSTLTAVWQVASSGEVVYAPYVHYVDEKGRGWGQSDLLAFAVHGWHKGDTLISSHSWLAPVDAPPLDYRLEAGMATRSFGFPPGPARSLGSPIDLGHVKVTRQSVSAATSEPKIGRRLDAGVAPGIRLIGVDGPQEKAKPGDAIGVDLLFRADATPSADLLVRLNLVDPSGQSVGSSESRPAYGQYPTREWTSPSYLRDPRSIVVPGSAQSGRYALDLKMIDAGTGNEVGGVSLGSVEVEAPPRAFDLPPMQHAASANFGGEIALRGYDADAGDLRPGGVLKLTLYWQALAQPRRNYTVFTHLLDSDNKVVAQQDSQPSHGASPTLGWAKDQVTKDDYEIRIGPEPLPSDLRLEIGLYDGATGERLRLDGGKGEDHLFLALPR